MWDRSASMRCQTCAIPRQPLCALLQSREAAHFQAWNIFSAPGSILSLWMMERYGLRTSLLWGFASQLLGVGLSWHAAPPAASAPPPRQQPGRRRPMPRPPRRYSCASSSLSPGSAYSVMYLSQAVGAFGQPLVLNNVARVAGDWRGWRHSPAQRKGEPQPSGPPWPRQKFWPARTHRFSAEQRDGAVTAAILAGSAGSVLAGLLVPAIVTEPSQLPLAFYWQARRARRGAGGRAEQQ